MMGLSIGHQLRGLHHRANLWSVIHHLANEELAGINGIPGLCEGKASWCDFPAPRGSIWGQANSVTSYQEGQQCEISLELLHKSLTEPVWFVQMTKYVSSSVKTKIPHSFQKELKRQLATRFLKVWSVVSIICFSIPIHIHTLEGLLKCWLGPEHKLLSFCPAWC